MKINKQCLLFIIMAVVLTSCKPNAVDGQMSKPGPLVSTGQVETVELGTSVENVWNCGNGGGTIVKHPSRSISTNHSVEWEVGGTTGIGVVIGEGVVPGGIDLSTSLEGHYRSELVTGSEQGTSWDLPAELNTIVDYTLAWRETWETGYIDVLLPNNSNTRVTVRYRTNLGSEIVDKQVRSCDGSVATAEQPTQAASIIPNSNDARDIAAEALGYANLNDFMSAFGIPAEVQARIFVCPNEETWCLGVYEESGQPDFHFKNITNCVLDGKQANGTSTIPSGFDGMIKGFTVRPCSR